MAGTDRPSASITCTARRGLQRGARPSRGSRRRGTSTPDPMVDPLRRRHLRAGPSTGATARVTPTTPLGCRPRPRRPLGPGPSRRPASRTTLLWKPPTTATTPNERAAPTSPATTATPHKRRARASLVVVGRDARRRPSTGPSSEGWRHRRSSGGERSAEYRARRRHARRRVGTAQNVLTDLVCRDGAPGLTYDASRAAPATGDDWLGLSGGRAARRPRHRLGRPAGLRSGGPVQRHGARSRAGPARRAAARVRGLRGTGRATPAGGRGRGAGTVAGARPHRAAPPRRCGADRFSRRSWSSSRRRIAPRRSPRPGSASTRVKASVPIWKHEVWDGGEAWGDDTQRAGLPAAT